MSNEVPDWDDMPEDMKRQLYQHFQGHEQMAMAQQLMSHEVAQWLAEKDEDELRNIQKMFAIFEGVSPRQAFVLGIIAGILMQRDGWCPCGVNHANEESELKSEPVTPQEYRSAGPRYWADFNQDDPAVWTALINSLSSEYLSNVAKYNLELVIGHWPQVRCKNCRLKYVSLEDRMKKLPDDCHGCQMKAGQGVQYPE